jgi:hypothetical protein
VPSSQKLASSPNITTPRHAAAFFYRRKRLSQPRGLCLHVGPRQSLARTLHREAEFIEHARDVVVVVPDAEAVLDQITDHRAGPDTAGVPGGLRACIDQCAQFVPLRLREFGRRAGRLARHQSLDTHRFIPLQPSVHGASRHPGLPRQFDDASAFDVPEHRSAPSPLCEVSSLLGLPDEPSQVPTTRWRTASQADCFADLGAHHDHLEE